MGTHPIFESDFDCLTDMYYLDDFLELLEPFSVQFRDDLKRIGELDEEVKSLQAKLKEKRDEMFKECEKKQKMGMSKDQIHSQPTVIEHIKEIKKIHNKIKEREDAMNLEPRDKNHSEATDEDDYQPTPVRRKNLSHNRN